MLLDIMMHSVGSEIQFARPSHGTHFDPDLRKCRRIEQVLEDSAIEARFEPHGAFCPIDKPNLKRAIIHHGHVNDPPGRSALQRRHHFSGAIRPVERPTLAASHAAINST